MRLIHRTALALTLPAVYIGLIDAECKFQEHAFIQSHIDARQNPACVLPLEDAAQNFNELRLLQEVKNELKLDYQPLQTPRKP